MNLVNIAILVAVFVLNPNGKAAKRQNKENNAAHSSVSAEPSTVAEHPNGQSTADNRSSKQQRASLEMVRVVAMPDKGWSDWIIFSGNMLLVTVGVSGVVVAVYTLRHIKGQTVAIKKQADHMVESERPFLMIEVLGDENQATFTVCNRGRSPAKILFIDRMLMPTYFPIGKHLPAVPDYGQQYRNIVDPSIAAEPVNAEWVPHGNHIFIGSVSPLSELTTLRAGLSPDNQIGPSAIWHFGVIVYKGMFSSACYESRYCYRLLENQWAMLGPHGYNEYK